jgi:hypothetical protein
MHRATWKNWERFWAHQLGGVRVPITGRQRGATPDVAHPLYSIEVKAGRVLSPRLQLGMRQATAAARGGRIPLLCISQTSSGRPAEHYVMLRLRDWKDLHGGPETSQEEPDDD